MAPLITPIVALFRGLLGYLTRFLPWITLVLRKLWIWLVGWLAVNAKSIWDSVRKWLGGWRSWGVAIPIAAGAAIYGLSRAIEYAFTTAGNLTGIKISEYLSLEAFGSGYEVDGVSGVGSALQSWGLYAYGCLCIDGLLFYVEQTIYITLAVYVLRGTFAIARGILGSVTS